MGAARVLVTPELLVVALCFPEGTRITNASLADRYVVLTVEHPDLRAAADATALPVARPTYRRHEALRLGAVFVSWGQD
jgi:hypothetical protein